MSRTRPIKVRLHAVDSPESYGDAQTWGKAGAGRIGGMIEREIKSVVERVAARGAAGANRTFRVGETNGQAAAVASGGKVLLPTKAAVEAAARGDWSLMRAESAAFARGATGPVRVFYGDGKGRVFRNVELPELLKSLETGQVSSIEIVFWP